MSFQGCTLYFCVDGARRVVLAQPASRREQRMSHIHVLHENPAWLAPLAAALDRARLPWRDWFLDEGAFDLAAAPPEGVFFSRMSASSHTRDHRYAAELTAAVLAWLERWGR